MEVANGIEPLTVLTKRLPIRFLTALFCESFQEFWGWTYKKVCGAILVLKPVFLAKLSNKDAKNFLKWKGGSIGKNYLFWAWEPAFVCYLKKTFSKSFIWSKACQMFSMNVFKVKRVIEKL